ncbi:DUF5082 family protein [Metabacillus herbersteinensis]|uniref:DUF5082 family protein n=1 Tax=Metabacillus herbersteinensis TaxID=283816 RepID=A0ABV6GHE8_9BACI
MDFARMLGQIHASISHQSADLEAKISRLERAKERINQEQSVSMTEIRRITQPELGSSWIGERANHFHETRNEAQQVMNSIVTQEYEDYQQTIEAKIRMLHAEKGMLDLASGLAFETDRLLAKGEDALDEAGSRINDLKRRLF